ncbi:hypothetical protein [Ancrocorticia populi]
MNVTLTQTQQALLVAGDKRLTPVPRQISGYGERFPAESEPLM